MTTSEVIADLVIHGGTIVSPDAEYEASVAIKDGMILAIGERQAMPQASDYLDATGLHILPGAIDVHVHFRDPGYPQKEDFASGTAAAEVRNSDQTMEAVTSARRSATT